MTCIKALYVYEPVILETTKVLTAMSGPDAGPGTTPELPPGVYRTDVTADITAASGFSTNSFEVIVVQLKTEPPVPPLIPPRAVARLRCNAEDIANFLGANGNADSI